MMITGNDKIAIQFTILAGAIMTNLELAELVTLEEDSLAALPLEDSYGQQRETLAEQINRHYSMLMHGIC